MLNDVSDSSALIIFPKDRDSKEILTSLEASMRLGENWKLILDATIFSESEKTLPNFNSILEPLSRLDEEIGLFQDEDFVRIELTRYF